MDLEPRPEPLRCPNCGAGLGDPPARRCAACGWWDDVPALEPDFGREAADPPGWDDANPYAPPRAAIGPRTGFHLGTLMLGIAGLGVLMAITVQVPALGVVMGAVVIPAVLRTAVGLQRGTHEGVAGTLGLFAHSTIISALTVFSAFLAFCATCFPVGLLAVGANVSVGLAVAVVVGLVAAGYVIYLLARNVWPIRPMFNPRRDIVYLDDDRHGPPRGRREAPPK